MIEQINEIETELKDFVDHLEREVSSSSVPLEYLKGWRIFYSAILPNPKILFIGINPGAGELNDPYQLDFDKQDVLHYIDPDNNNYSLARNTVKLFDKMNLLHLLENSSVKINSRFYATRDIASMYAFENALKMEHPDLFTKLMECNKKWLKKLIETINPEVIICEGIAAYNYLDSQIYDESGWKNELDYDQNKICGYYRREDNLILFGYTRNYAKYDIDFIANSLKPLLQN